MRAIRRKIADDPEVEARRRLKAAAGSRSPAAREAKAAGQRAAWANPEVRAARLPTMYRHRFAPTKPRPRPAVAPAILRRARTFLAAGWSLKDTARLYDLSPRHLKAALQMDPAHHV